MSLKFSIICKKLTATDKIERLHLIKLFKFNFIFFFSTLKKKMYYSELELIGLGYRISVKNKILRLKLGYSHIIFVVIPGLIFVTKRKTKLLVYSLKKKLLSNFVSRLLRFKKLNVYKIKGLKQKAVFTKLKPGKRTK